MGRVKIRRRTKKNKEAEEDRFGQRGSLCLVHSIIALPHAKKEKGEKNICEEKTRPTLGFGFFFVSFCKAFSLAKDLSQSSQL